MPSIHLIIPVARVSEIPENCQFPPADIREYITKVYNMSEGPLHGDLEDAMTGILQVQHVHDLRAADVSSIVNQNSLH